MNEIVNPVVSFYNWFLAFFYYLHPTIKAFIYVAVFYFVLASLINLFQHLR